MDSADARSLALDIERIRGKSNENGSRISRHEKDCERRYASIEKKLDEVAERDEDLGKKIDTLIDRHHAASGLMNGRVWAVAGAIISMLIAGLAWTGAELYHRATAPVATGVLKG